MALSIGDTYKGGIVINLDVTNKKILLMNTIDSDVINKITYSEAYNLASNGTWGGYTDWRMPDQFELQYINKVLFLGVDTAWVAPNDIRAKEYYWTSSFGSSGSLIRYNITRDVFNDLSIVTRAYARAVREESFDEALDVKATDVEGDDLISWDASGNSYDIILKDFLLNIDLPRTVPQSISNPSLNTFNISKFFIGNKLPISDPDSDNEVEYEEFKISFASAWTIFSFPFNISTLKSIRYINSSGVEQIQEVGVDFNIVSGSEFGESYDSFEIPDLFNLPYNDNKFVIIKNNAGDVYLPEYNFNSLAPAFKHQGYQIKNNSSYDMYFTAKKNYIEDTDLNDGFSVVEGFNLKIIDGWNVVSFPVNYSVTAVDFCEPFVDQMVILKDKDGSVYLPSYNYDGIGVMTPGQGYQVKLDITNGQSNIEVELK